MTLALPWRHMAGEEYESIEQFAERTQANFDKLAQQFPLGAQQFARVPSARVYRSAPLAIASGGMSFSLLTFNSERYDHGTQGEQHSTSSNTARLTCQLDGLYSIKANIEWEGNATGVRHLALLLNASTVIAEERHNPATDGGVTRMAIATDYRLSAGEFVVVGVYQTSGSNLNVNSTGNLSPEFMWHWVCP